jgi:hypothetical protein
MLARRNKSAQDGDSNDDPVKQGFVGSIAVAKEWYEHKSSRQVDILTFDPPGLRAAGGFLLPISKILDCIHRLNLSQREMLILSCQCHS